MSNNEAAQKAHARSQTMVVLGVLSFAWIVFGMAVQYRHGLSHVEWLTGATSLAVLVQLWRLHEKAARSMAESISDPLAFNQLSLTVTRIEMLVVLAALCAGGIPKFILRTPF